MLLPSKQFETIVIIPARGGSKGVPRKNLQILGDLPLLAYSILAAKQTKRITRVVVSTEDQEIASVAKHHGAEVPFLRPASLAGDRSDIGHAVAHILEGLRVCENYDPDIVAQMYPSHPFRKPALIDHLLSKIEEGYESAVTVRPIELKKHAWFTTAKGSLCRLHPPEGVLMAMRPYALFHARTTRPALLGTYVHPLHDPVELIDIDDPEDLTLARYVVKHGIFRFSE